MTAPRTPYQDTSVPVERSKEQIRSALADARIHEDQSAVQCWTVLLAKVEDLPRLAADAMGRHDGLVIELAAPVGEVEFVVGEAAQSASGGYGPCRVAEGIVGHADLTIGAMVVISVLGVLIDLLLRRKQPQDAWVTPDVLALLREMQRPAEGT